MAAKIEAKKIKNFHKIIFQEISEFKTLLKYFNDELGPAVCIYTVINISWALAGIVWLFKVDSINIHDSPATCIAILNVILWISLSTVPFVQVEKYFSQTLLLIKMNYNFSFFSN